MSRGQKGASVFLMLCYTMAAAFLVMTLFKVVPVYVDNLTIRSVLDSLDQRPTIRQSTPAEVKDWIDKGFQINGIRGIARDAVRVRQSGAFLTAEINYERRIDLFANVDVVISFENSWKIKQQ